MCNQSELVQALVVSNTAIAPDIFSMVLHTPGVAEKVKPGQFAMVYLDKGELLLPRPISFCDADKEKGTITMVYQVVGKGTEVMAGLQIGQSLKILGPLGNGFMDESLNGHVALIGGGIGTPPLLLLAKELVRLDFDVDVFLGFRSDPILIEEFKRLDVRLFVSTDDGSFGNKGSILDVLKVQKMIYNDYMACGPEPMLKAVADYVFTFKEHNATCRVSVEERMACGLGTCVGCVIGTDSRYRCICQDGPVFFTKGGGGNWIDTPVKAGYRWTDGEYK